MSDEQTIKQKEAGDSVSLKVPGTYRMLFVEEPSWKKDLRIHTSTLSGLRNFVKARKEEIVALAKESHFLVQEENTRIILYMREHGGYTGGDDSAPFKESYAPMTLIEASAAMSADAKQVAALIKSNYGSPHDLGMVLRENAHLFASEEDYKRVVAALRTMKLTIRKIIENMSSDTGDRTKLFEQKVEELPELKWSFAYNLLDGENSKMDLPVRLTFTANQSATGVDVRVFSHTHELLKRAVNEALIKSVVNDIKTTLGGDDVVPFIYVNASAD